MSHLESYCSVLIAGLLPIVIKIAGSVAMKSTCTPAYRLPSEMSRITGDDKKEKVGH